jgi:hypothetical protein
MSSFKNIQITNISSELKFDFDTPDFRDLNKKFGRPKDYLELKIYNLNDVLITTLQISKEYYEILNKDSDNLSNEIKINFNSLLKNNGFNVGKYKLKLCVYRPKVFTQNNFSIKEISTSRKEIRAILGGVSNNSFDAGVKGFIAERNSAPYFKDFILKFLNLDTEALGINIVLNTLTPKHEILLKTYEPLPSLISLKDKFLIVEEIIDPLILMINIDLDLTEITDGIEDIFLQPNFNIDTRTNNSIPSAFKDFNSILDYSLTSSYHHLLSQLENKDVPEISYDYIRPISSSTEIIDIPSHFENFVHFGSATERIHNFKYKLKLIELYDSQLNSINAITGNALVSSITLTNKENIISKKLKIIQNFDGYEKFLYFTKGDNDYTWPKLTTTYPYQLYSVTSSQVETWLGEEGQGISVSGGQLHSASIYDNTNPYNLEKLIPAHIVDNKDNKFYVSFVNMIGQHFDHIWTHIKHITEVNDTHHVRGISKELVWYQLKALGIDAFDQFENTNLIEYILGQGSSGSAFYDTPVSQSFITASNEGSIPKGDITKGIWKRLYHNAPYLLKTKGTERGIRALMACYGVPSTLLNIKEYGGSTPVTGASISVDPADYYKIFTYEKGSLALKTNTVVATNDYMVRFPWKTNNVGTRTSKTIELRIKPTLGNSGIALSLGNTTTDSSGFQLKLDPYYGNDISSSGDASTYGRIQLKQALNIRASTPYFPLYNGDFWNLHLMGTGTNVNFGAYQTNFLKNTFKYTGTYNGGTAFGASFGGLSGNGREYVYAGVDGYQGTIQELKSNWGEQLTDTTLTKHSLEPFMYSGNTISSSFSNVIIRLPLGSTDSESLENHPPDTSLINANTIASSSVSTIWEEIFEEHYLPTPDTVGKSMTSEKVRIDTGTIDDDILLPFASGETSTLDRQPQDFSDLGIHFSPTMEINEDILYTLGSFRLDDYIGNPLPSAQSSSQYTDLKTIKDYYFKKVNTRYNYWDYIKLIQYVDHTLFKIIEKWVPWKANTKTGLLIEPHYLERNKFSRTVPVRSDGKTMTTGLHGMFNADVQGEQLNELYNLSGSAVITHNNPSNTLVNEQRADQGTNGTIFIFDTYLDPSLKDPNGENNQESQAPIVPFNPATGKPQGYKSHSSNDLLGNITRVKISNRYYRTLRNGKETDF